jgi:hypothetical protein
MYLKGQKILYIEAKTLCEQRLSYLMLPTICITAICSVISIALKEYQYGALIVSSLNALNFFFLNLINYLKLDAKAEAHRVSAYKFDRIQSKLEFNSGKILFIKGASKELEKLINETQNDVREIKETNQFVLPEDIRHNYPRLNTINVFSEVKKIQFEEIMLVNQLKDIMNLRQKLAHNGVDTRPGFTSAVDLPYFHQTKNFSIGKLENSNLLSQETLILPHYPEMTEENITYVCEIIRDSFS